MTQEKGKIISIMVARSELNRASTRERSVELASEVHFKLRYEHPLSRIFIATIAFFNNQVFLTHASQTKKINNSV